STAAATLLPLVPPPPDLTNLVPFAEAPVEKPPIAALDLPLPRRTRARPEAPASRKALECGRSHYAKGEYEDAAQDLEQAARKGTERELITEARYWLAETYYRLNRFQQADQLFRQV